MDTFRGNRAVFILLIAQTFFCSFHPSLSTSLIRGIRDRQDSDAIENKGPNLENENWMQVPSPIHDVLLSIDEKLRGLDTFSYTLKLARLDFSLDQLSRRMENIETKLGRLETKFDVRMEKVEEVVVSKDIKEEFSNDHLSRRIETLNEKINTKASYLDAKLDIKLDRITSKLELLERDLHNSVDEILERLIKNDERYAKFEDDALKREKATEDAQTSLLEMKIFMKDDLANIVTSKSDEMNKKLDVIQTAIYVTSNQKEKIMSDLNKTVTAVRTYVRESSQKLDNLSQCIDAHADRPNSNIEPSVRKFQTPGKLLDNLTEAIETRLQAGEAKLQEIDKDMDFYTRKVVNSIQDLWKTSNELKTDLSTSLKQSNDTKELIRSEFKKLQKQIEPLTRLEPRLVQIREGIDSKVSELGKTVDNSFATLLVAQNSFISSCRLIQEEEMHVYDILQQIVHEMRNRSTQDIRKIDTEIRRQGARIQQSLTFITSAVTEAANSSTRAVEKLRDQISRDEKCVSDTRSIRLETVYELCRQIVIEPTTSDEKTNQVIGNTAALKEIRQKILQALADATSSSSSSTGDQDYDQESVAIRNQKENKNNISDANDPIHIASDYEMDYRIPSGMDYK